MRLLVSALVLLRMGFSPALADPNLGAFPSDESMPTVESSVASPEVPLLEIIERMAENPAGAVKDLMVSKEGFSKGWLAYLAFQGHIPGVPAGPGDMVDSWMAQMPSQTGLSRPSNGHYPSLESVLMAMRYSDYPADYVLPCWLIEAHPEVTRSVFGIQMGTAMDWYPRLCRLPYEEGPEMQAVHTAMNALSQEYLRTENDWMEDRSEVPGCGSIQAAYSRVSLMDLLWFALFPPESLQERPSTGEREAQQASWASKDATGQRAQLLKTLKEAQAALRPGLVSWFKSRGSDESHAGLLSDRWLDIQLDNDFRWDNECLGRDLR